MQPSKLRAALTRHTIDADKALAAKHEALSIAEERGKDAPDETIITRKTKGSSGAACGVARRPPRTKETEQGQEVRIS